MIELWVCLGATKRLKDNIDWEDLTTCFWNGGDEKEVKNYTRSQCSWILYRIMIKWAKILNLSVGNEGQDFINYSFSSITLFN